jgi:hypothetical protein
MKRLILFLLSSSNSQPTGTPLDSGPRGLRKPGWQNRASGLGPGKSWRGNFAVFRILITFPLLAAVMLVATGRAAAFSCISITSPLANATVSGTAVALHTNDTCSRLWFEGLYIDGSFVNDFSPDTVISIAPHYRTVRIG